MEKLQAKNGMYLTQSGDINDVDRVYTKEVILGANDSASNWRDADESEKTEFDNRINQ